MNEEKRILYCGECPLFLNENIDGSGECRITKNINSCGDSCELEFLNNQFQQSQQKLAIADEQTKIKDELLESYRLRLDEFQNQCDCCDLVSQNVNQGVKIIELEKEVKKLQIMVDIILAEKCIRLVLNDSTEFYYQYEKQALEKIKKENGDGTI